MKAYILVALAALVSTAQAQAPAGQPAPPMPRPASAVPQGAEASAMPAPPMPRPSMVAAPANPMRAAGRNPMRPAPRPEAAADNSALPPGIPVMRNGLPGPAPMPAGMPQGMNGMPPGMNGMPNNGMPFVPPPMEAPQDPVKASGKRIGKLNGQDIFKLEEAYYFDQTTSKKKQN